MFTGIVEAMGTIVTTEDRETTRVFRIRAPGIAEHLTPGDSVSVDGACLTAVRIDGDTFTMDVIGTTLERTVAGSYEAGCRVNLERAMKLGARMDGHLVQGHVDGVGHLVASEKAGEFWMMDFAVPEEVLALTVEHGSITLNGVSLTVSELPPTGVCRIGVIPFTHEHTNLGSLRAGDGINVEGDMIGKYVGKILSARGQ
jgi:riboflavin synthase